MRLIAALPLLLLACEADPTSPDGVVHVDGLVDDENPPPLGPGYLELGVNSLDIGEAVNITVRGAFAGETVNISWGTGYGQGPCVPSCMEILNPSPLATAIANNQGVATFTTTMPAVPIGMTVAFEAFTLGANAASSSAEVRRVRRHGAVGGYRVGNWHQQDASGSISPDAIIFQTVEVTEQASLLGFSFRAQSPGAQFKAGLYSDNGGTPGQLIASSNPTPVTAGIANALATTQPTIPPGRYWIATVFSGNGVNTWHTAYQNEPEYIILQPFGNALPASYNGGNFYMSVGIAVSLALQ